MAQELYVSTNMLFLASTFYQDNSFEVLSVERTTRPVYRMGFEVTDTIVIRRDVLRFTITLSPQHTICGPVQKFAVGDHVSIKKDNVHDGDKISRDSIKLVH